MGSEMCIRDSFQTATASKSRSLSPLTRMTPDGSGRPERDTGRLLPRAVTAESTGSPEAGTLDFLSGKLSLIEFSVAAPLLQQLLMRSGLSDSPRIHDYHKIRVLNR